MATIFIKSKKYPDGFTVHFDDQFIPIINKYHWYPQGNRSRVYPMAMVGSGRKNRKAYTMHKLLFNSGELVIDHRDNDGMNNLASNIRFCTNQQNSWNSKIRVNNKTGYKGVSPKGKKYLVSIRTGGKQIRIGSYINPVIAAAVYNQAALKYFGEFARLNEIPVANIQQTST